MNNPLLIGLTAGSLTSFAAVPQVVKALRSKSVRDLSFWQPCFLTIGVGLWLFYGVLVKDTPLIVMNIIPLLANIILVYLKMAENQSKG
ncbi:SemiSWEET transporter (plasmid) [Trichlorobacter lovleyi]|uniref:SemiSWEET family sugar transporter n=1 Tax=Trichlorobacter lovleyi TaxID=313985 RepID=UPI00223F8C4D|nr:SemiSWEET transporter [Trichlorobacter lovleyi]QOX80822.1 SemiSWEET transporter [Trichlorobacter lovleyi]